MHLITPKYVYPQKVICTPKCLTQGVHVPLNQNVSGNAAADNLSKQFGPSSGQTKRRAWSGSKLFDANFVFLKDFSLEEVNF